MSQYVIHGLISWLILGFIVFWGELAMAPIKRHRIDWDNIPIIFVPADKDNPNPLNRYAKMTTKERRAETMSKCGEVWARIVRDKLRNMQKNTA